MYFFRNLADLRNINKIKIVYQVLVKSIIGYGIIVWEGTYY